MKSKFCSTLLISFFILNIGAQNKSGKAVYHVKRDTEVSAGGMFISKEMDELIYEMSNADYEVLFSNNIISFKREKPIVSKNTRININFADLEVTGSDILFSNLKSKNFIHKKLFNGSKLYLIEDDLPKIEWKIHNVEKEIDGYKCKKATATLKANEYFLKDTKVIAWFVENKTIVFPSKYFGLNGTIVELTTNDFNYKLKSLEFGDEIEIVSPKEGVSISQKAFKKVFDNNK
ncbi:GLPGLI family protein [uncultured Psychroserpens sp.]|uniref:GLPGLI family protein n=1 Tax=uncultured Psychroserpens sp. TaxID=255436 RepID=UPI0026033B24|nr:GLPGLI family protein [uncultured Psychroserpens sp.]